MIKPIDKNDEVKKLLTKQLYVDWTKEDPDLLEYFITAELINRNIETKIIFEELFASYYKVDAKALDSLCFLIETFYSLFPETFIPTIGLMCLVHKDDKIKYRGVRILAALRDTRWLTPIENVEISNDKYRNSVNAIIEKLKNLKE